jgi:hypothetical protein
MSITRVTAGSGAKCTNPVGLVQGVWQSLATRAGGEVISADQF